MAKSHPSKTDLSAFLLGKLPTEACDQVASHIDVCPSCQETIRGLDSVSDSLVTGLRTAPPPAESDPKYQRAVEKAASLPSQASSSAASSSATRPSPVSLDQFTGSLVECGLMSDDEIREFINALPADKRPRDSEALAKDLVKAGKLTRFQALNLCQGKAKNLVMGEYLVLDKIGAGGMGQVFKAQHRRMKRIVAIKVLPPSSMKTPDAVQRFQRETQAAARLMHPNIVTAFDAGQSGGLHFLVMEFVDGQDLSALMKQGPLSLDKALDYILQAGRGLAFAHGKGIVHRDIKPANLLLDKDGVVRILDMGLARIDEVETPDHQLTNTGAVMGTIDYMAPEQALDTHLADARSDIYSLGCAFYRLLTGQSVFAGKTVVEKILAHREQPIPSLHAARPEISPALDNILTRMLAKKPVDRYQTMNDALVDLEAFRTHGAASPSPKPADNIPRGAAPQPVPVPMSAPIPMQAPIQMPAPVPMSPQPYPAPASAENLRIQTRRTPPQPKSQPLTRRPVALGLIGLALVAAIGIAAGVIFKLQTKDDGTLAVEVNEPDAEVQVLNEQNEIVITRSAGQGKIKIGVDPGKHRLRIEKDGFKFFATDFEIASGKETPIKATLIPIDKPQAPAVAKVEPKPVAPTPVTPPTPPSPKPTPTPTPIPVASSNPPAVRSIPSGNSPPPAVAPFDATAAKTHQENWARHLATTVETTNSLGLKMVLIPPGEFMMGSSDEQIAAALKTYSEIKTNERELNLFESKTDDERPQHRVIITRPFQMGATEVTMGQFKQFVAATQFVTDAEKLGGGNSSLSPGTPGFKANGLNWRGKEGDATDDHPVMQVTWNDAIAFCNWLSEREKLEPCYRPDSKWGWTLSPGPLYSYRLPTEAEWEYACRGGTNTQYSFGDDVEHLPDFAWFANNSGGKSHPVATRKPNSFGLFDMHGNVREWCDDRNTPYRLLVGNVTDPRGPTNNSAGLLRGGSWYHAASLLRSAYRYNPSTTHRYDSLGFRIARTLDAGSTDSRVATSTTPIAVKPVSPPLQPSIGASDALLVCEVLQGKAKPKGLIPEAVAYTGPSGNGRRGANGLVLTAPAGWEKGGTSWKLRHERNGSATGVILIHPHGTGHVLVQIVQGSVNVFPGGPWPGATPDHAYTSNSKFPISKTADFASVFPLDETKSHELSSTLRSDGSYSLSVDGKQVVTASVTQAEPFVMPNTFVGDGLSLTWLTGQAGVIIGPLDGGLNKAEQLTLTLSAPNAVPPGALAQAAAPIGPSSGGTDLIHLVDKDRDTKDANWKVTGATADFGAGKPRAYVSIPLSIRGSYQLETRLTIKQAKETTSIYLPVAADKAIVLDLRGDGGNAGSSTATIKLQGITPAPTATGDTKMQVGTEYKFLCKVGIQADDVYLEVLRDDQIVFQWSGKVDQIKNRRSMRPGAIELETAYYTSSHFELLQLKMVSGQADPVTTKLGEPLATTVPAGSPAQTLPSTPAANPPSIGQPTPPPTVATATPIPAPAAPKKVAPGLLVLEFPRVRSQDMPPGVRPDLSELSVPVGQFSVTNSLKPWKYTPSRNAMAVGWLKVDVAGEYTFQATSFDSYHAMFLDGKPVSCPREGDRKTTQTVKLAQGMTPITLIGTIFNRGAVSVEWQPPGQAALSEIPPDRLFCDPNEGAIREKQIVALENNFRSSLSKPAKVNLGRYQPGLVVRTYERLPSQSPTDMYTGGVDRSELTTPVAQSVHADFSPWKYDREHNHVASGYLKLDRPGEYAFYSNAGFDRDALYVNGELLMKFRLGEFVVVRTTLPSGLVPIEIIGYVLGKQTDIQWCPPGQRELSPVPPDVLFHNPTERPSTIVAKPSPTAPTTPTTTARTIDPPGFTRPANALPPAERIAVPLSTDQEKSMELVKEVFKDDYAKLKQPDEKLALAGKLMQQALKSLDDPTGKYVMLREALRLAIDAGDPYAVEQSATALTSVYNLDEFNTLADSWDELLNKTRPTAVNKAVAEQALAKIDRAVEAEEFAKAARLSKIALEAARKSKDNTLVKQVTDREKSLASEKQQWETLTKAATSLAENPDDPAANLSVGRHLCFVAEDWEQGLPMLVKSSDVTLKNLAAKSLAATEATALVEIGDAWWTAADKAKGTAKTELLTGASHFYRLILPALTGLQKTKIEKRLGDIPTAPMGTRKGPTFNLNRSGAKNSPQTPAPTAGSNNNVPKSVVGSPQIAKHFLQMGGTVTVKPGTKNEVKVATADALPPEEFTIVAIQLSNNKVLTDVDLVALRGLTTLRVLALNGTNVSDAGLASLPGLTGLEDINLSGMSQLSDQGMVYLSQVTSLKRIVLNGTKISDAGLSQFKTLVNLDYINLAGTPISGAGFATFTPLKNLRSIGVENTPFSDEGMAQVRRLSSLHGLDIGRTQLTDAGMSGLKDLKELTSVDLYETATSDVALGYLQGATNLQRLRVGSQATDAGMAALQKILPKCKVER